MTLHTEKDGQPLVRLPRPLHSALYRVAAEREAGLYEVEAGTSFDTKALEWGLVRQTENAEEQSIYRLTAVGLPLAGMLEPLSADKRTQPPWMPLAEVLRRMPLKLREWLREPPPIRNMAPGPLFEALGVLTRPWGEDASSGWELTPFGHLALHQVDNPPVVKDGVTVPLTTFEEAQLTLLRHLTREPIPLNKIDGRVSKPLGPFCYDMTEQDGGCLKLRPELTAFVEALLLGEDSYELFRLLPEPDQLFIRHRAAPPHISSPRAKLFVAFGWFRKARGNSYVMTRIGEKAVDFIKKRYETAHITDSPGADLPRVEIPALRRTHDEVLEQMKRESAAILGPAPDPFDALDLTPVEPDVLEPEKSEGEWLTTINTFLGDGDPFDLL